MPYSLRDLEFRGDMMGSVLSGWGNFEIFRGIFGFWFFGAVLGFILEVIFVSFWGSFWQQGIIAFNPGRACIKRSSA